MMEIDNFSKVKIDRRRLKKIIKAFLEKEAKNDYHLAVSLLSPREMAKINLQWRGKESSTDVLSFPALLKSPSNFYGEILLEPEFIKKEARKNKKTFLEELDFVLVHGLLHLSGMDDQTEKDRKKMIKTGQDFLANL